MEVRSPRIHRRPGRELQWSTRSRNWLNMDFRQFIRGTLTYREKRETRAMRYTLTPTHPYTHTHTLTHTHMRTCARTHTQCVRASERASQGGGREREREREREQKTRIALIQKVRG